MRAPVARQRPVWFETAIEEAIQHLEARTPMATEALRRGVDGADRFYVFTQALSAI